jgi:hypothetical protein
MRYLLILLFTFIVNYSMCVGPEKSPALSTLSIIEGKVIDELTGEGLPGVEVKLLGTEKVIYTDFEGNFSILNITPGNYSLSANFISYKRNIITGIKPVSGSSNYTIKLKLIDKSAPQCTLSQAPKA